MFLLVLQFLVILHSNHKVVAAAETGGDADDYGPRTGYACEGSTLKIECAPGLLIRILRANYGRFLMAICNDGRQSDGWNLECMSSRSLRIVSEMCDLQPWCIVPASNTHFGDTCSTTFKYLEIEYNCAREKPAVDTPQTLVSNGMNSSSAALHTSSSTETKTSHVSAAQSTTASTTTHGIAPSPRQNSSSLPPSLVASTQAAPFCEPTFNRNIHWPRAKPGETVITDCPNNPAVQKAIWQCGKNPVAWLNHPDLSGCVSPQVEGIKNLLNESFNPGMIEVIAGDLVHLTELEEDVFGGDLSAVTAAMQEAVDQVDLHVHDVPPEKAVQLVHKVNQAVLQTSSNLLDKSHFESWKDLPQSEQAQTATRMMSTIENSAFQVARTLSKPTIVINVTVNIVVEVRIVNVNEPVEDLVFPSLGSIQFDGTDWADCDNSITLTGNTIRQLGVDGLARVVFATYNNMDQWLHSDDYEDYSESNDEPEEEVPELKVRHGSPVQNDEPDVYGAEKDGEFPDNEILKQDADKSPVVSKIISASVNGRKGEQIPLEEPIIYTLEHITDAEVYNPSCSFWEYSEKTMDGKWSTVGCDLVHTNTTHTTCQCTHLTNFAVLMSVKAPLANLSNQQKFTLSFITYFGCILSIVCLIICFITFVCFKNLWCDRNTIHANLVACLCVAEIVFLFGIIQYDRPVLCSVIAGVLHYLFLVTFAWMCLEGIQLYVLLVEVFEVEKPRIKWYYLAAYAIPAFIVGISAIVYHEGYGTDEHCWLSTEKGFIWAFVGPVCVILFVNFVMLTVAIVVMCRHASSATNKWKMNQKTKFENVRSWVKTAMILVVLLGLTWTFGLFYINEQSVVMAYVFAILNSLQGVFIFIFHCIMNDKVMKEYKRWVRHTSWIPESLLVRCGGARASISTSPINSSSSGKLMKDQKISLEHLTKLLAGRQRKRSSTTSLPSSSNQIKRGYNRMQRNSSGRDSSHLTDSGIACNDEFSHIYSEPTEDPNAYLEPVRLHLGPTDEYYMMGGDISMIEGSVADTDYLEDYGRHKPAAAINVDKYKIMPLQMACYNNRLSTMSEDNKRVSESSDYSDTDAYALTPDAKKTTCQYEQELLSMPLATDAMQKHGSDESLVRKKLMALNDDMPDVLLFNNLNKPTDVISKADKHIAEPNIGGSSSDSSSTSSRSNQSVVQETVLKSSDLLMGHQVPEADQTRNSSDCVKQTNNIDKANNSRVTKR